MFQTVENKHPAFYQVFRIFVILFASILYAWRETTNYTYDETTGLFATLAGEITVPAASYTQDPVTGAWLVNPGVSTLVITGTI